MTCIPRWCSVTCCWNGYLDKKTLSPVIVVAWCETHTIATSRGPDLFSWDENHNIYVDHDRLHFSWVWEVAPRHWMPRTAVLCLLSTALGGVWSVEQPGGSLMEYFPTWREVVQNIFSIGGPHAVSPLISLSQASADRWWISGRVIKVFWTMYTGLLRSEPSQLLVWVKCKMKHVYMFAWIFGNVFKLVKNPSNGKRY